MKPRKFWPVLWLCVLVFVVSVSCGGGPDDPTTEPSEPTKPAQTTSSDPTSPPEPTPESEGETGPITNLQDVKSATVQIEAQGTFVDPEFGLMVNAAGSGSGLIIDPSGIAVTNNHVVTGAALLKVWVSGETDPRNAKVLGVSECSDLAVIDIDGEDFPYLEWYPDPIDVGLEIYIAGYPLGDPEFTLTRGVVSKARADGETNWASVDYVLEYDATSNPGNSGGPVVNNNGQVIAVHYAGNSSTRQAFGIARDKALEVVEKLREGTDVNSIGINGTAVIADDQSLSGIWVSSVKSGSPADEAGVLSGDIIVSMEGLVLATDGTMADYCDILRSHNPDDTLSIEVLRYETQEMLEGQLNGRELELAFSFADQLESQVGDVPVQEGGGYASYTTVTDDYGAIQTSIPDAWVSIDGRPWEADGDIIGAAIYAAPNLDNFFSGWLEPGMFFGASDDLALLGGYVQLLDFQREFYEGECTLDGRYEYEDILYEGRYDLFTDCGGEGNVFLVLSAVPKENRSAYLIMVQVLMVNEEDFDALDQILNSFEVVGSLP